MKKIFVLSVLALCLTNCTPKKWMLTSVKSASIAIDSSLNKLSDQEMSRYILPIKQQLDKEMNQVIGQTTGEMRAGKPESLLSNWTADVYLETGNTYLHDSVDFAVVNLGGLRSYLPEGNIAVRNIFELMPFENELTLLWLKGDDVHHLLQIFASEGGQGVSGVRFEIINKKAENILIGGKMWDKNKIYVIATNDYLAGGNDRMVPFTKAVKKIITGLKIRNILMEKVIRETYNGNKIHSVLDGRIK